MERLRKPLSGKVRRAFTALSGVALLLGTFAIVVPARAETGGFISIRCRFSHQAGDDPIVSPGLPGVTHLHQFFGSTTTTANSTYRSMVDGSSSCRLSGDTAGYWAPALLAPDGTVARTVSQIAYYRALGDDPVRAFPPDLRMIAGYPTLATGTKDFLGWGCSDGEWEASPPDCRDRGRLKASITFPSCWDGVNLDSPDHRSHMAYRAGKNCPDSHPVALPTLKLHITYDVADGRGYMLSSDMKAGTPGGGSLHADFWNTWDQDTLEGLVSGCLITGLDCGRTTDANLAGRLS